MGAARNYAFPDSVFITPVCSSKPPWNNGRLLICLTEHVQPHNWWSRCNGVLIKRIYDLIYADGYYTVLTTNNTFTYCYGWVQYFVELFYSTSLFQAIYIENQGMRLNCRFVSQYIMIKFSPDNRVCWLNGNISLQTNHKFKIRLAAGLHLVIATTKKMQICCIFPIRRRWCSIIKVWFSHPSNSLRLLRYSHEHIGTSNHFHLTTRNRLTPSYNGRRRNDFPRKIVKRSKPP